MALSIEHPMKSVLRDKLPERIMCIKPACQLLYHTRQSFVTLHGIITELRMFVITLTFQYLPYFVSPTSSSGARYQRVAT